ncbi:MAG: dihydroorotase [Methylococcaceae bacterium]|nr:dihydroorotase [Methylococcaceae bacterium]
MQSFSLIQPDDWHLHLRDGDALAAPVPASARQFARAIVMPNLKPPVTAVAEALAYRARILEAVPVGSSFEPLMTLYLTESTPVSEVARVAAEPSVHAFKLYPAGATTHSEAGVARIDRIFPVLEAMAYHRVPLLVHGEVVDSEVDIFDRETVFIDTQLAPLVLRFPGLPIVLEHITTEQAVAFVRSAPPNVAATITAHHLLYNRNAMLAGGIRPHYYCLPVLKREQHRRALVAAATSGDEKFFLGTDSAPHGISQKEKFCGCAGCFTAHAAIEFYASVFEAAGRLDKLEAFASLNGPKFYRLPVNSSRIRLVKSDWRIPGQYPFADEAVVPLMAGESLGWRFDGPEA